MGGELLEGLCGEDSCKCECEPGGGDSGGGVTRS